MAAENHNPIRSVNNCFNQLQDAFFSALHLLFLIVLAAVSPFNASAQLENANWYFPGELHLDFTSTPPALGMGFDFTGISSLAASSSISNGNGSLLLTVAGRLLLNANGDTITRIYQPYNSGSWTGIFSYTTNLIIPKPCSDSLFYVFYDRENTPSSPIDAYTSQKTLHYYLIDISANGGYGAVIDSAYVDTISAMAVRFDACRHSNGRDFWFMNRPNNSGTTFHAWLISDTGVAATPVISNAGAPYNDTMPHEHENVRFSPNASMLAVSGGSIPVSPLAANNILRLFHFDNQSGSVSYFTNLDTISNSVVNAAGAYYYGPRHLCFSADNSKLYTIFGNKALVQYDLTSGNAATVASSLQLIHLYSGVNTNHLIRDLQLGMDGKIYCQRGFSNPEGLSVIHSPNVLGSGCNFQDLFYSNYDIRTFLPHVIHNIFQPRDILMDSNIACAGDSVFLAFDTYAYSDSTHWYVGNVSTSQQFFASDSAAAFQIDSAGIYPIMGIAFAPCRADTFLDTIEVFPIPELDLGADTTLCQGDSLSVGDPWPFSVLWSTGDTTAAVEVQQPDSFWVELSHYCGLLRDTVVVDSVIPFELDFPTDDTLLCAGDTLWIDATIGSGSYVWHDNSTDSAFAATAQGSVWVTASSLCGTLSDTMFARFTDVPIIPDMDSVLCSNSQYFLDLTTDSLSWFLWYDGDSLAFDTIDSSGVFWIHEWNICGSDSDTFSVDFVDSLAFDLGSDTTLCELDSIMYDLSSPFASFVWSTGDSVAAVVLDSSNVSLGLNTVLATAKNACGTFLDSIKIDLHEAVQIDLGPDTILCEGDTIEMNNPWQYGLLWSTGDTMAGIQILEVDTYWLQVTNACGVFSDTVIVDSIIQAIVEFGLDDTLLCDGDTLLIDATVEQGTYTWHDGSLDSVFYATEADTIWVEALNVCNITPATDTMIVRFTDIPVIPELDSVLCSGESYFIDLTTDSVSQFVWYDGDAGAFDTISLQNTYWVKEWNVCGHDSTDFLVAFVNDPQTLLGDDTVLCISDTMRLDATTPFGAYVWNTGDTSGAITIDESYLSGDSNHYIVTVYNACKSDTDDIIIAADHFLTIDLGDDIVACAGDSVWLDAGDFPRTTYEWQPGGETTHEIGFIAEDNRKYKVLAHNACGTFGDSLKIFTNQPLSPNLDPDQVLCVGDTLLLHAGDFEHTTYRWGSQIADLSSFDNSPWIKLIAGESVLPNDTTSAIFILLENTCGIFADSVWVEVDSLPTLYAMDSVFFCEDSFAIVSIEKSDIDYLEWNDGSRLTTRKIDQETNWQITFVNHCGSVTQTLPSVRKPRPDIKLESPQKICDHELVLTPEILNRPTNEWSPENRFDFLWSDGTTLEELPVYKTGSYAVTVTTAFGCADSARVQVKTCGADWYVPNAFTPGGNDLNEFWKPTGEGFFSYEVTIFDRWGKAIFSFTEKDPGWNGTANGQPAPGGVYTYQLTMVSEEFPKGNATEGKVVVVR